MVLVGKICFYTGLFLTALSVISGFGLMYANMDDWAKLSFMVVPLGFLLLFTGLTTGLLFSPSSHESRFSSQVMEDDPKSESSTKS